MRWDLSENDCWKHNEHVTLTKAGGISMELRQLIINFNINISKLTYDDAIDRVPEMTDFQSAPLFDRINADFYGD